MFLTRMAINGARRGAWKLLQSPQAMHAAVLSGFPPDAGTERNSGTNSDNGRVLWRLDHTPNAIWLYVTSSTRPDFTHIVEQAGWPTLGAWETKDYASFLERLQPEQHWVFRICANPVHAVTDSSGSTKRYGHVTSAQQQRWLLERADANGFAVVAGETGPDLAVTRRERKSFRRGTGRVTLDTVQFDGQLRITDADVLRRSLINGIGRAKGYGCGLMTLAPVPR